MKVFIIEKFYKSQLQEEINNFIVGKFVTDIKYQVSVYDDTERHYAMILYKEKRQ